MKLLKTSVVASDGVAFGRAFVVKRNQARVEREQGSVEQESELFAAALSQSREQIALLAADSDIFAAHLEIIDDEMLSETVLANINDGQSADSAVVMASEELVAVFEAIDDEYLAARAADVKDIFARIAANLAGGVVNPFEGVEDGDIIVDSELLPSDMALLDFSKIRGFITSQGSATSHVCIIARNMSIPAVVGLGDAVSEIATGDRVILDGCDSTVVVNPDIDTEQSYRVLQQNYLALQAEQQQMAELQISYNGEPIAVLANAGSVEEVETAVESGADGIGLFRSEFIYMHSTTEPTEEEQYQIYSAAVKACNGRPITIRTLDIGGDKAVPYLGFPSEDNPFLGWRAIRVSLECRDMFSRQLRALLRASAEGDLRVMFPMVVSLDELLEAKSLIEQCKVELAAEGVAYNPDIKVGVMIETPAAVLVADSLAANCDFFSIGTNDLVQYVMAADRANAKVSYLYDAYSPAVMRAIEMVIAAADSAGIECSMCGELASDSAATERLLAMHLRKYSVNIGAVCKIKYKLNQLINQNEK